MNISRIFILRPVATSLLMVAVLLAGTLGYYLMPLSALPQVDYPTIQVVTLYPGAGPDVMTATVTAPLERQFGQLPGLKQMSSASSPGASVITLQFDLSLALDIAEQQVQAAINAAGNFLPQDLPSPPIYSKVNPADAPIMTLAATSNTLSLPQVQDLIETRVAQKISQLNGVGLVTISGGQRPAVRVQVDSGALAVNGLSLENIRSAIASANINSATGSFNGPNQLFTIDINDQLSTAADYRALVLRWQNGAPLRLGDVAKVVDAAENSNLAAWKNTQAALIVNIQRQPGTNVIAVANQIKALLPVLRESLPGNLELTPLTDRTITIRASVRDVWIDLLLAVVLVVGTIYIFLRNARATLIPAMALPLSVVGTFGVMYLLGFSVNNLTLMALTIAAGFVVDDAIVMIENIARHVEEGKDAKTAALDGAKQIAFTIISLTFSLIAVLIPLLFMGDVIGRLFKEFAVTLAVAILISAVISLTFTPMLCARMLRPPEDDGVLMKKIGEWINRSTELYGQALTVALKHQKAILWMAFGTLTLTILMYIFVPKGLFPVQDTGLLLGISEAPQNVSFSSMADYQQALAKQILRDPAVDSLSSFIGVDGTNDTPNAGRFYINLKPHDQRDKLNVVLARLKESTNNQPGATLFLQPVQDLTLEDRITRTQYQFSLEDSNPDELAAWVPKLLSRLEELPQLRDVTSDMYEKGLQAYVEVDRQSAARVGLAMADVDAALYNAFGQRPVSTIFTQANQYRVVLEEIGRPTTNALEAVGAVRISNASGVSIPLSSISRIYEKPASLVTRRQGQLPSANISFNLAPGVSLGEAIKVVEKTQEDVALPQSIRTSFQGATLSFRAALTNQIWLLLAALITMYIVLGVLYESYIHPLTILSTLPSAGVGALLALWIADAPLDMFAVLGLILLIGIVKKNAIMMIDFAVEAERNEHLPPSQAIVQACLLRFRPIMMTTFAALFGALPLMISSGVGAELRHPLGITLVGGLILSQLITLFTTPVIYLAFHRLADKWGRRSQAA